MIHCNRDTFYASVDKRDRPKLVGKAMPRSCARGTNQSEAAWRAQTLRSPALWAPNAGVILDSLDRRRSTRLGCRVTLGGIRHWEVVEKVSRGFGERMEGS